MFSLPIIPGGFSTDANPHDTINKLRAHAESARKIGNTAESETFHHKANEMIKKHGEPKSSGEDYESENSWNFPQPPSNYKTKVMKERFRRAGFQPSKKDYEKSDRGDVKDHPNPDGSPRKRRDIDGKSVVDPFRGVVSTHIYTHPKGHSAILRHGHLIPEQKHVSHEYEIKTNKGKTLKGTSPEHLENHIQSEGIKGTPRSYKSFHGVSQRNDDSHFNPEYMYKKFKSEGKYHEPGALTSQSK